MWDFYQPGEGVICVRHSFWHRLENEKIKAWLMLRLRELSQGMDSQLQQLSGGDGGHLADLEEMSSDVSFDGAVLESFRSKSETIAHIEDAIRRINDGTYGACEHCQVQVGEERLKALPFASMCIDCQRKSEDDPNFGLDLS